MKITILKRLVVILMAVLILASAAVGVSAAYVDMLDHGLAYTNPNYYTLKYDIGAGESFYTYHSIVPYWALDTFDPDYTYTFSFSFTSDSNLTSNVQNVYLSNKKLTEISGITASKVYLVFTKDQLESGYKYEIIIKLNPGVLGLDYFPLYVYAACQVGARTMTTNSWSVSAEYDPGGSNYLEYLADIRDQLHAGDDYMPPSDAVSSLDSSVSSINSAEGAVRDKSSDLVSSVSEDWTQYQTVAKNAAVSLKPAAATVNNIYALILDAVPDEVIALFIAIALLLFIGWLIGRVRE
nr:MAG TPA: hypothetical protein [Inoviridae sp.]